MAHDYQTVALLQPWSLHADPPPRKFLVDGIELVDYLLDKYCDRRHSVDVDIRYKTTYGLFSPYKAWTSHHSSSQVHAS